jgi:MFS family permease
LARTTSFLGDSIGLVALILYVADTTGTGAAVGVLLMATDFTPSIFSPVVGTLVGRMELRSTMVVCEVGQATLVGTIVLVQPKAVPLFVLVALQSLFASAFQAASRTAVVDLVDDDDLEKANALIGAGTHGLEALGPLLAAGLLQFLEPRGLLGLDVLTFVVSGVLLAGLPRVGGRHESDSGLFTDARAGVGWMWRHRTVRAVALGFFALATLTAVDDVALAFLGKETFRSGDSGVSLLYAGVGVGLLLGFLVLSRGAAGAAARVAVIGFALCSIGNILTGVAPALLLAFAAQSVRGIGASLVDVGTTTLVQRSAPPELRARVFANLSGGVGLAAAISYLGGGALVDVLSPRTVLILAGVGGLAASAVTFAAAREQRNP